MPTKDLELSDRIAIRKTCRAISHLVNRLGEAERTYACELFVTIEKQLGQVKLILDLDHDRKDYND